MKKQRRATCCASRPTTSTSRSTSTARRGWISAPPPSCAPWSPIWKSSRDCTTNTARSTPPRSSRRRSRSAMCCRSGSPSGCFANRNEPLAAMLEAAMGRRYSAAPETFFTGGGLHNFANFDPKDNGRVMDVWEATRNSVNLVYIRIMRDIVRHYASASPGAARTHSGRRQQPAARNLPRPLRRPGRPRLHQPLLPAPQEAHAGADGRRPVRTHPPQPAPLQLGVPLSGATGAL